MGRKPRVVEAEVRAAVAAARWLEDSDRGAVRVAFRLAEQIDRLYQPEQTSLLPTSPADHAEVAGRVGYLAQQLAVYLDRLLLTARARLDSGAGETDDETNPFAILRNLPLEGVDPTPDSDPGAAGG